MDIKSIKALADLMEEKDLISLEYSEGDKKIQLKKAGCGTVAMPVAQPVAAPIVPEAPVSQPAEEKAIVAGELVTSPLVGVGYLASAPGAAAFAPVGSKVKKGQVLCIIEAMKVMNEFNSPLDGEIAEVCFEDGQMVEYGQPLFRII